MTTLTRRTTATPAQLDALDDAYKGLTTWPTEGDYDAKARALLARLDNLSLVLVIARRVKFLDTFALTELRARGVVDNFAQWNHAAMVTLCGAGMVSRDQMLAWAFAVADLAARVADPGEGLENDGGTCNHDTPMVYLPRARRELMEGAAKAAGLTVTDVDWFGRRYWWVNVTTYGQAMRRSTMAEAAGRALRQVEASGAIPGLKASMYLQAD